MLSCLTAYLASMLSCLTAYLASMLSCLTAYLASMSLGQFVMQHKILVLMYDSRYQSKHTHILI